MRGSRSRTTGGSCRLRLSSVGPAREIGQHDGQQLAQLGRAERAAHREVLQAIAGQLDLAEAVQRQVPVVLAERDARRHHGAHARVGGDGEPDLGGAVAAAGIDQRRLRQKLLLGDPGSAHRRR